MDWLLDRMIYPLKGRTEVVPNVRNLYGCNEPCVFVSNPRAQRAAVFLHGNESSLADVQCFAQRFGVLANCDVLCVTFAGYPGHPCASRRGRAYDADIAFKVGLVAREVSSKYKQVFVMGHSLGCNAVLNSVKHFKPSGGLVLLSPFYSLRSAACHRFGSLLSRLVPADRLSNYLAVRHVACDVLIMHGNSDDVVPPLDSSRLALSLTKSPARRVQRQVVRDVDHALSEDMATSAASALNDMWPPDRALRPRPAPQLQFRT